MLTVSNGTFLQFSSKLIVGTSKQGWDKEKGSNNFTNKITKN